jgi:hypothetical protein
MKSLLVLTITLVSFSTFASSLDTWESEISRTENSGVSVELPKSCVSSPRKVSPKNFNEQKLSEVIVYDVNAFELYRKMSTEENSAVVSGQVFTQRSEGAVNCLRFANAEAGCEVYQCTVAINQNL